jgi:hypothetical protein
MPSAGNNGRSDMSLRGAIGAYSRLARYSPGELTMAARRGFLDRFLRAVDDATPGLGAEERQRRASALLTAHMLRLSRLSAISRRTRRGGVHKAPRPPSQLEGVQG